MLSPGKRLFVPAGQTPVPLYEHWEQTKPGFLGGVTLIQIDEVLGEAPIFKPFFEAHLPSYLSQFEWIKDTQAKASGDVALLGLGLNGHVGFHEPGVPDEFHGGRVPLQDKTRETLSLPSGAEGLTYGLGAFQACERVVIIVKGECKRKIYEQVIAQAEGIPAAQLASHDDAHIITYF